MPITLPRRGLLVAGVAALLPLRQAVAQAAASGGGWMSMVQAQHLAVAKSFEKLLASGNATFSSRAALAAAIGHQLTAHSVAEENVLYPALAMAGMVSDSDKLYLDQAHAKVLNASVQMQTLLKDSGKWMEPARALQAAVLQHAKEDEEGRLYPQLQAKLSPEENALLTQNFAAQFASVGVPRVRG